MVEPSSTFSSEQASLRKGRPTALILAVAVLVLVEAAFRLMPAEARLGYGRGLGAYYEVVHTIRERGAAQVAVVGSSRGRESISVPMLSERLRTDLGRDVDVANYSCPDARADIILLIVRGMLASPRKPDVLVYFVAPRVVNGVRINRQLLEVFGAFPDEFGDRTATRLASLSERFFWNVRNVLGEKHLTFRHRYRIRYLLTTTLRGRPAMSPVQGGYTMWQRSTPRQSLLEKPSDPDGVRRYVRQLLDENGDYVLGEERMDALRETFVLCREAGVKLVLVEEPLSDDLRSEYPPELIPRFLAAMEAPLRESDLKIYTMRDLGVRLGPADFRDHSHVNLPAAERITASLATRVISPILSGGE